MPAQVQPEILRVAVVEDLRDSRESLVYLIDHVPDMTCVAAVGSAEEALEQFPPARPDLVLLDIQLAGAMSGTDCITPLRERLPNAQIVMLTQSDDANSIFRCLANGADGYLHKIVPPDRLASFLREAAGGGAPMSPEIARLVTQHFQAFAPVLREWERLTLREREVLLLLTRGLLKKEIADRLKISEHTVHTHCAHIYDKLHVSCREHAVARVVPFEIMGMTKYSARKIAAKSSDDTRTRTKT